MAHNINENRMFCVGKAWHNSGIRVESELTSAEAIRAAGLDYNVAKLPAMVNIQGRYVNIPDTFSIVREDSGAVFKGTVGNSYKVIQNVRAFDFFDEVVGQKQAIYHSAGALGLGEKIWMLAKLPQTTILFNGFDVSEHYLLLTNTHDGSGAVKMYWTAIRVVCQNTLNISLKDRKNGILLRHSGDINAKIRQAKEALGFALKYSGEFNAQVRAFSLKQLSTSQREEYFKQVLNVDDSAEGKQKARQENIVRELEHVAETGKGTDIEGVKGSLWGAYNAVTEYVDHVKAVRGGDENKTESILFGNGARIKEAAYTVAVGLLA